MVSSRNFKKQDRHNKDDYTNSHKNFTEAINTLNLWMYKIKNNKCFYNTLDEDKYLVEKFVKKKMRYMTDKQKVQIEEMLKIFKEAK